MQHLIKAITILSGIVPQQLQEQISQLSYSQFMKQQQNPYAQIVTNISQNKDPPPPQPITAPSDNNKSTNTDISKAPVIYGPSNLESTNFIGPLKPKAAATTTTTSTTIMEPHSSNETKEITMINSTPPKLKPLVHYDSDSDVSDTEDDTEEPPSDIKTIIEKMASYVSKNGSDFESIVKSKGDQRFEFLNETHKFHPYYKAKIKEYSADIVTIKKSPIKEEIKKEPVEKEHAPKVKEKKIISKLITLIIFCTCDNKINFSSRKFFYQETQRTRGT